jgi:hypothetical protein
LLAYRFGDGSQRCALLARLRHAVKAGHAEAVQAICCAVKPTAYELNLAIRCQRVGVLACVLAACTDTTALLALRSAQRSPKNAFGGVRETVLVFDSIRERLCRTLDLLNKDTRVEEATCRYAWLFALRSGFPGEARLRLLRYLSVDQAPFICHELRAVLDTTFGMHVPLSSS